MSCYYFIKNRYDTLAYLFSLLYLWYKILHIIYTRTKVTYVSNIIINKL